MLTNPLIAILRGVQPDEAVDVARSVLAAGIDCIEVPLNSPQPFESIQRIVDTLGDEAIIGAGTVLSVEHVERLAAVGGKLVVSPNFDLQVVTAARRAGLYVLPGVFTPSECFAAWKAGSTGLKLFPASLVGPEGLKALKAVLPAEAPVYVVGGVDHLGFRKWVQAGAAGFGLGSSLYRAGYGPEVVGPKAREAVNAWSRLVNSLAEK